MNIKEIALKVVAAQSRFRIGMPAGLTQDFAEALIAELAKQNEPVAYIFKPNNELLWPHEVEQNVFASDPEDYELLYTKPQPDRVAELEAALSKFKDALFDVLIQDMSRDKALAKINEVLKP